MDELQKLPDFYGVLYGHYGSATPKLVQGFTPYNSEIALLPSEKNGQSLADYLYTIAGVRMQSFSDFQIQNVYDYLQMVGDLAARKLPAHAYTKEISFARLLGMTGIKVNMSVMFDIDTTVDKEHAGLTKYDPKVHKGEYARIVLSDEQGDWVYNIGDYATQQAYNKAYPERALRFLQSIGFADAVKLQQTPGYSGNVGIIAVAYSNLGIRAMLDDERIRYIIPYHKSSLPEVITKATHIVMARNYESVQNTVNITSITDSDGNSVKWDVKEATKRLGSAKAALTELSEHMRNDGWTVKTKKAETGHGSFGLYEDLMQTNDPRKTAENYFQYCAAKGELPVFFEFADHDNYYKLCYDFNVMDCLSEQYAPQGAVTNTYPTMVDGQLQAGNVNDGNFDSEYVRNTIDRQMQFMEQQNRNMDRDIANLAENASKGNYAIDRMNASRSEKQNSNIKNFDRLTPQELGEKAVSDLPWLNGSSLSYVSGKDAVSAFHDKLVRVVNDSIKSMNSGEASYVKADLDRLTVAYDGVKSGDEHSWIRYSDYVNELFATADVTLLHTYYPFKQIVNSVKGYLYGDEFRNGFYVEKRRAYSDARKNDIRLHTYQSIYNAVKSNGNVSYQARNSEYMRLAENKEKNKTQLEAMVRQEAIANGYNSPMLYHGTRSFGFTKFDVEESLCTIFVSNRREVAETYSGKTNAVELSGNDRRQAKIAAKQTGRALLEAFKEYNTKGAENVRVMPDDERRNETKRYEKKLINISDNISDYAKSIEGQISADEYDGIQDIAYKVFQMSYLEADKMEDLYRTVAGEVDWGEDFGIRSNTKWNEIEGVLNNLSKLKGASDFIYEENGKLLVDGEVQERLLENYKDSTGIMRMYGKTENQLVLDADNRLWNELTEEMLPGGVYDVDWRGDIPLLNEFDDSEHWINTRMIAQYAKEHGYSSLLIRNVRDNGGKTNFSETGDVYVYFDSSQLKSADNVTYDESGNIIPLSERFNSEEQDIRYSGRTSRERAELYEEAYMDGDDDLMGELVAEEAAAKGFTYKAFHHTENRFTRFDINKARKNMDIQGFYFSASPDAESEYGSMRYDVFLKMENPYVIDSKAARDAIPVKFGEENYGVKVREWLQENGYDSVIRDADYYGAEADEYIVFENTKIKSADEVTFEDDEFDEGDYIPLENRFDENSDDIRYQTRDFSYEEFINKPDMEVTTIGKPIGRTQKQIASEAKALALKNGGKEKNGAVYVTVKDTGANVYLTNHGLRHGLDRRTTDLEEITVNAGEIIQNSILLNEGVPKDKNASGMYILIGAAKTDQTTYMS